jgi:hypothetical protein
MEQEILMECDSLYIQGDPGRKLNILGGDIIGYCEKSSYQQVSNSEWLQK